MAFLFLRTFENVLLAGESVQVRLSARYSAGNGCSNRVHSANRSQFSNLGTAVSMGYQSLQGIAIVAVYTVIHKTRSSATAEK